jgi:parvulin-like peptidyl-prolyl isomerase
MLQQAAKSGFEKKAEVQAELDAARESALFDLYVRDVVASEVVSEADLRKFYDENQDQMVRPERAHVRYLLVSTSERSESDALALISQTMSQLFAERRSILAAGGGPGDVGEAFSAAVRKVSDDPTAPTGGNLGWVTREELESQLAETAFSMTAGTISGIIKTANGYVLLFVEGIRPAEKETFEQVRAGLREYLLAQKQAEVVAKLNEMTSGLYSSGKIEVFRENVD